MADKILKTIRLFRIEFEKMSLPFTQYQIINKFLIEIENISDGENQMVDYQCSNENTDYGERCQRYNIIGCKAGYFEELKSLDNPGGYTSTCRHLIAKKLVN